MVEITPRVAGWGMGVLFYALVNKNLFVDNRAKLLEGLLIALAGSIGLFTLSSDSFLTGVIETQTAFYAFRAIGLIFSNKV